MLAFTTRRLTEAALTLFVLITLVFFLLRLAPGGPFDDEKVWPPEVEANINRAYGLDQPLHAQYLRWLHDVARLNLNESFHHLGEPVIDIIAQSFPLSAWMGFIALLLSIGLGVPLGCVAAWKRGSALDSISTLIAISGVSLPTYLIASALALVFSLWLDWLPPALYEGPRSIILPVATLALRPASMIARLTRTSMLDALASDYTRTARSKGLSETIVVFKHALKNSLIPAIALLGPLAANLVTGSFIVELVFQIPGVGKYFVSAVLNRDYPLVMGITLLYGVLLLACNLVVDLAYGWIDPRMRTNT